ncbi:MAG: SH3 domain-containing protein [Sedimenticolaceae bacterium]
MPPILRLVFCLFLFAGITTAGAAHITDKLVVGMYAEPGAGGSPLTLLSSGAPLEVLQRRDGFVEVRLADERKGWVEATYVTEEKPAKAMLLETQARLRHMGLQLAALKEKCPAADETDAAPVVPGDAVPGAGDTPLRQALDEAEARIAQLEQQLAASPPEWEAQQRLDQLQGRVRQALDLLADAQVPVSPSVQPESAFDLFMRYRLWIAGLVLALLGFVAGAAFLDYRFRRRHGGFRL